MSDIKQTKWELQLIFEHKGIKNGAIIHEKLKITLKYVYAFVKT